MSPTLTNERRLNPQVYNSVNRDLDRLFTSHLADLLRTMEIPWTPDPRGNPHPPQSVIGALVLKIYYSASYDEIEARLKGTKQFYCKTFDVDRIPTHSVIHRGMKKTTTKYLRNLLEKTIRKVEEDRRTGIDSSGFTTKESSKWYDIRIGKENQKKDYLKLHLLVDVDSGQLLDARMTRSEKHDSPVGKAMLKKNWGIATVSGDKAYFGREACSLIADKNADPYLKPKENATRQSKGHPAYARMMRDREKNPEDWNESYHVRSFVESVFSSIKKRFGRALSSIKQRLKKRELLLKAICYNIKEALYNSKASDLGTSRWVKR